METLRIEENKKIWNNFHKNFPNCRKQKNLDEFRWKFFKKHFRMFYLFKFVVS